MSSEQFGSILNASLAVIAVSVALFALVGVVGWIVYVAKEISKS